MMKHLILTLSILLVSNHAQCAFLKKTLSFKRDAEENISEQKSQIKILNEARNITIALLSIEEKKIQRYVHPSDLERIFWELKFTSTNPLNCLQIICDADNQNKPKISSNPCYPCYTWKLQPLYIGKAILQLEQFKNDKCILSQWVNVTITE